MSELRPGKAVVIHTSFRHSRRERVLADFMEESGPRRGFVILACEGPGLTFDPQKSALPAGPALAALGIWITIRVVNRRVT